MRYRLQSLFFCLATVVSFYVSAQDFSNKGKEFWLAYCYHVGMGGGGAPAMTLYITADVNTNYKVEIYGASVLQTGSIVAGQVISINIPNAYFINDEGLFTNKAIRVTGEDPIVVYSYITRNAASGATLCLPTNVLGREYYSMNFTQASNENNSNSYFTIIAVDDNTAVEITPSANTKDGWLANTTYTVNLNKGDTYQVLGTTSGQNGVDLTGSKIKSVASGTAGCKKIAVFSGSGKIKIPAINCNNNSADNLYQQLYPTGTWGKKFLTVPSYSRPNNYYRIAKSDPSANVYLNGTLLPAASFVNNFYYEAFNGIPNLIESDKPISVAQYFTTQNCDGNGSPYDPDMIVLNSVEQNIDKVTLISSNLVALQPQHHIHVIMRNGGTGLSSFAFDGNIVSPSSWIVHPADPAYSYLYLKNVSQGYHRLTSDSGFNALAYGYANFESYGYSAGANVKDLYQFVSVQNQYATVNFPAACKSSPFNFSMTFPYQPTQIKWIFSGLFADVTTNFPVSDSTWLVNGKQLYRYKLPTPYTINTPGIYPITVLAQNPTSDGCSGDQEINYDLQVFERPAADFNFKASGCVTDSVHFADNTNVNDRPAIQWAWNFDDGNFSTLRTPAHLYASAGSFNVKYSVITDIGCLSDTITKIIVLTKPPIAKFGVSAPGCVGKSLLFTDSSTTATLSISKWYWDFGDGSPLVTATSNANQSHTYSTAGIYIASLKVETPTGCQSIVFTKTITISANPVAGFNFGNACLPTGAMSFTNTSAIAGGTGSQLVYRWDFGDGTFSFIQNPIHNYTSSGPFNAKLQVTSNAGCADSITKPVNTIYAQPQAVFVMPAEVCNGGVVTFTDQSLAPNSTVTQWQWDFGDGVFSTQTNPAHTYAGPGSYTIKLLSTSAIGCVSAVAAKTITVNPLPSANFTVATPTCVTKSILFSDGSVANAGSIIKWIWNFGDGTSDVKTTNSPVTHVYATTGTFTVTLQVETDKGCVSALLQKQVMVNPLPVPGFIVPGNCINDVISQFTDTSKIADGTGAQFAYLWNFGDGNATPANPNTSTLQHAKHKYTAIATYSVSLTITSNNGCDASITQPFTINGAMPQSSFSIQGGNEQCSNVSVDVKNNSTVDFGQLVKLEIFWDYLNDPANKTTVNVPSSASIYSNTYPEFFNPATKDYTVRVVAYSGESCLSTASQVIKLKATPQLQFNAIASVCADKEPFQIKEAAVLNSIAGSELFSGPGVTATGIFNPSQAGIGLHTIRYTFTALNGCRNFKEQTIQVFPTPVVSAGADIFVLEGGTAVLLGSASGNSLSYSWMPVEGLNNTYVLQPQVTPAKDVLYTLKVTSADGCSASDQVFVKVLKTPTIPNVFTPNNDGINDRWQILYLESYPGATVEIYNRYGQLIFQSVGYGKPWDGSFKGAQVPAGTYYYIINPKNGRRQMSGFVDVVR